MTKDLTLPKCETRRSPCNLASLHHAISWWKANGNFNLELYQRFLEIRYGYSAIERKFIKTNQTR